MTHGVREARRNRAPLFRLAVMAASAAMIFAGPGLSSAHAQAAPASASGNLVLLHQIQGLQAQMRELQGQIEELQHRLQQLQQAGKDQYVDLDSRVGKLERAATAPAPTPVAGSKPAAAAPASTPATHAKPAADKADAQVAYDDAFKALRAGNYVQSARGFRDFIEHYPASPLVPNAYYWLGGSYYVTQNYQPALQAFQALLQKYPDSGKAPETHVRVADCQLALKDFVAARHTLEAAIKAYPGTPTAKRAHDRLLEIPAPAGGR